jgi:heme-degrading monooxygenase HmoA
MPHACVSVYYFQKGTAEETLQRARDTAYPIYRQRPGFVGYELIQTGEESGIGVTTWETAAQAQAATGLDDQWINEHGFTTVSWVQEHVGPVYFSSREGAGGKRA